jgi:hypothetical protein
VKAWAVRVRLVELKIFQMGRCEDFYSMPLTGELAVRTDLAARPDRAIDAVRPFKQRRRGRSGGELLVTLAEMMVVGGDHLVPSGRAARGQGPGGAASGE